MALGTSPKLLLNAVSWQVRGLFATEANRRLGFAARSMWQPAEIEARRGIARDLATEITAEQHIPHESGYRMLATSELPDLRQICALGSEVVGRASEGQNVGNKRFFRNRIAREDQRLALLRVALDRHLIALVSSYLGVLPVITEADFFASEPTVGSFSKSQLWHCDDDAGDVVKVFVYCEDVGTDDGPFDLVTARASLGARTAVGYRYAGRRYRVSDEAMNRETTSDDHVSIIGPKGTAFVVDTVRCFHRGSRIVMPKRRRIVGMICYCPPVALTLPRRLATGEVPLASFIPSFSGSLERAVLGAPVATRWI